VGKLTASHRYNLLPLLPSDPGGLTRSWSYRTYPYVSNFVLNAVRFRLTGAKVRPFSEPTKSFAVFFTKNIKIDAFSRFRHTKTQKEDAFRGIIRRLEDIFSSHIFLHSFSNLTIIPYLCTHYI